MGPSEKRIVKQLYDATDTGAAIRSLSDTDLDQCSLLFNEWSYRVSTERDKRARKARGVTP